MSSAGVGDTIVAVATPPGDGARAVVRLSGDAARRIVAAMLWRLDADAADLPARRGALVRRVEIFGQPLPARILLFVAPRSYTGEDVVELHVPGAPIVTTGLVERALALGARRARPGEFTRRAFESGRISLAQAEAVLDLIHAASIDDARRAAATLAAGTGAEVGALRDELLGALSTLESGLDFEEGETGAARFSDWGPALQVLAARLRQSSGEAAVDGDAMTAGAAPVVVLSGDANAGKSTLFNALLGRERTLVSPAAGTTRDVVSEDLVDADARGGLRRVVLCDLPGRLADPIGVDARAGIHAQRWRDRADVVVHVHAADRALATADLTARSQALVVTMCDRATPTLPAALALPVFHVCAPQGMGIDTLRGWILAQAPQPVPLVGERRRAALLRVVDLVERACQAGACDQPLECAALELREALLVLEDLAGRTTPEDVLDRIFARFCLGK